MGIMDKFARGPIRAEVIAGSNAGCIRIDGPVNMRCGKEGMTLHPATARHLAEWILSATSVSGDKPETKAEPAEPTHITDEDHYDDDSTE